MKITFYKEVIIAKSETEALLSGRKLKIRLKTAKGRKISSTRWLERQLNDPFVQQAKISGYRSRSAFKIIELNDKFDFFTPGSRVVDLGCAPGGWSQIAVDKTNAIGSKKNKRKGYVLGLDLKKVESLEGARFEVLDFLEDEADEKVKMWLNGEVDVVMSDMAPGSSGHKKTDHLRIINLCEQAAYFSFDVLASGGTFVAKVLAGGAESELQKILKTNFKSVSNVKPSASRSDSSEKFVVAKGFRV